MPTTAACPEFTYTPENSAFVVEQLIAAGAIPIGKTNLDQFATGLVGTRSLLVKHQTRLIPIIFLRVKQWLSRCHSLWYCKLCIRHRHRRLWSSTRMF
ncbi:amidase family protein [Pseudoalteromonas sp. B193]